MGCNCGKKKVAQRAKPVTKSPKQVQTKSPNRRIIRRISK